MDMRADKIYRGITRTMEKDHRYEMCFTQTSLVSYCFPRWLTAFWSYEKYRKEGLKLWDKYMPDIKRRLIDEGYKIEDSPHLIKYRVLKVRCKQFEIKENKK